MSFTLSWQFTTLMTGIQGRQFNLNLSQINKLIFYFLLNHLSFHPNGFSSCLISPIPPNTRLMALPVERMSLHILMTLVMLLLVKDKVCALTPSVTSVFHIFFLGPTNELTTDKGTEKGRYFHLLQKFNKLLKLLQRMSENQLCEQFSPILVKVAMLINWQMPWFL